MTELCEMLQSCACMTTPDIRDDAGQQSPTQQSLLFA